MIYRHNDKAESLVHIYLSFFFFLAKVIFVAKGISKSNFISIVSPWNNPDSVIGRLWAGDLTLSLISLKMKNHHSLKSNLNTMAQS